MNATGRLPTTLAWLVLPLLTGCDGEATGLVLGTAQSLTGSYAVGQNVRIVSPNGRVAARRGSAADEIVAAFQPFVSGADDEEQASEAMASGLTFAVDDGGNTIVVSVTVAPGSPAGLGADIAVSLPTSFSGGVEVEQSAGAIDVDLRSLTPSYVTVQSAAGAVAVRGARGQLDIAVGDGPCSVQVDEWSPSDGTVALTTGNLDLAVKAGISGRIDAVAGRAGAGTVVGPSPLPDGWSDEAEADNHHRFTFGPDAASLGIVSATTAAEGSSIAVRVEP